MNRMMNDDFNSLKLMFYAGQESVKCQKSGVLLLILTRLDNWDGLRQTGGSSDVTQGSGTLGGGRDICGVSDDDDDDVVYESDECEKTVRGVRMSMSGKWHLAN